MTRRRWIAAGVAAVVAAAVVVAVLASGGGSKKTVSGPPRVPTQVPPAQRPAGGRRKTPERAERGLEIALQDNAVFLERYYYDRDIALQQARQLGVSWIRTNVLWSRVEPSPGRFDWSQYDSLVAASHRYGINVEMSLTGMAPAWATGNGHLGVFRPDAARFGQFAHAAALHFRGLVTRYSIWNEPNFVSWLRPLQEQPGIYRRLYEAGWSAVKDADPNAQVLIGETAAYAQPGKAMAPLAFLRQLACRGCTELRADGYAHHPYEFTTPPESDYPGAQNVTIGSLSRLTRTLDQLAADRLLTTPKGKPLPVYLTEFGYFASGRRALPASVRADWLVRAFEIAARLYPRVRQMLQYLLVAPPPRFAGGYFDTSIVSLAGQPEAPFAALSSWASREQRRGRVAH
jgi:Beta-galactosidase